MQSLVDKYNQNVSSGKIQREKEQERLLGMFDTLRIAVEQNRRKILFPKSARTPKEDRIAKLTSIITQPTTNTDVNIEFLAIKLSFLEVTLETNSVNL